MSLTKTPLKEDSLYRVKFTVPWERAEGVRKINLVGEFNGWGAKSSLMRRNKNGSFTTSVVLPKGREYQYRYLLDDSVWINDEKADDYRYCAFGDCDNSILSL